ncbi:hypothetical protein RHGRI_004297 [Rhododendron griersonianum]|uniref:Uncharacterized protein n=1 Tax=Rhododendron griersonianum TaxID=479676 RepID=A0AAV6L9W1_9ERIC|nr:hypothetical protein RHGRI_004297 [Rhododendron griersonianum]
MKILSWIVKGLSNREKRNKIKKTVRDLKIDMLLLQETNLKDISKAVIGSLWGVTDCDYLEVDAIGSAGGPLTIWNSDFFKLEAVCCNRNFILLKGSLWSLGCGEVGFGAVLIFWYLCGIFLDGFDSFMACYCATDLWNLYCWIVIMPPSGIYSAGFGTYIAGFFMAPVALT